MKELDTEIYLNLLSQITTRQLNYFAIQTALFDYLKWFEIGPDLKYDDMDGEVVDELLVEKDLRFKPSIAGNQFKFHDYDDIIFNEKMKRKRLESETKIEGSRLLKIKWDRDKDDSQVKRCIAELAKLLSHLRCDVKTWTEGDEIGYSPSLPEHPKRAAEILFNLARGHALLYGRNFVTMEDVPIVVKTVLSTAQIDRVSVFSLLLANNGRSLSTTQITESLAISPPTARKKMVEFKAIGLVDEIEDSGSSHERSMKLKSKFNWFFDEEFIRLRDGFEPADYSKYMNEEIASDVAEKESPSSNDYSSAYEKMVIFDRVFNELANEHEPSAMEDDKGTVGRYELQKRLVSTGVFDQVDALIIIDEMVRIKRIKIVMVDTYRRDVRGSPQ